MQVPGCDDVRDTEQNGGGRPSSRKIVLNFVHEEVIKDLLSELGIDTAIGQQPDFYNTALVLLSAPVCGPDTRRLAKFTGLPCSFIVPIRRQMIQAGLWTESEVYCHEWYLSEGELCTRCFWLDVLVAEGLLMRIWNDAEGRYCYGYYPDCAIKVN